jgi:Glyoxalase-like domain/SnoaL-like polyketide cyclase
MSSFEMMRHAVPGLQADIEDSVAARDTVAVRLRFRGTHAGEVMFQQITGYHAPRWPDPAYPQQFHLDVTVGDVDAAGAAVLKLGATSLSSGGVKWRVYADPAGKPFCPCWD